jgi:hypothetical protein
VEQARHTFLLDSNRQVVLIDVQCLKWVCSIGKHFILKNPLSVSGAIVGVALVPTLFILHLFAPAAITLSVLMLFLYAQTKDPKSSFYTQLSIAQTAADRSCYASSDSYHEIIDLGNKKVYLGEVPQSDRTSSEKAYSVDTFVISVIEPHEYKLGNKIEKFGFFKQHHINVCDRTMVSCEDLKKVTKEFDESTLNSFYVHCKNGRGRSAQVVAALIISKQIGILRVNHTAEQVVDNVLDETIRSKRMIWVPAFNRRALVEFTGELIRNGAGGT